MAPCAGMERLRSSKNVEGSGGAVGRGQEGQFCRGFFLPPHEIDIFESNANFAENIGQRA